MHHGFYAIIPAPVLYNENLIPHAKLLYGTISAMCQKEGYCWAKNETFAELYHVHKDTIGEWLDSLEKEGFIFRQTSKDGFKTKRLIWLSEEFKKCLRIGENAYVEQAKTPTSDRRKDRVPNKDIKNIEILRDKSLKDLKTLEERDTRENVQPLNEVDAVPSQLSQEMFQKIKELNPDAREPNWKIWDRDFDRMIRIDKRSIEEITSMIDWVYNHDFWYKNILSPSKLREKWDKLVIQQKPAKSNRISKNRDEAFAAKAALNEDGRGSEIMILKERVIHSKTNKFANYDQDEQDFKQQLLKIFNLVIK
jgi:DNA-binding MarR family transcriptional regulator